MGLFKWFFKDLSSSTGWFLQDVRLHCHMFPASRRGRIVGAEHGRFLRASPEEASLLLFSELTTGESGTDHLILFWWTPSKQCLPHSLYERSIYLIKMICFEIKKYYICTIFLFHSFRCENSSSSKFLIGQCPMYCLVFRNTSIALSEVSSPNFSVTL